MLNWRCFRTSNSGNSRTKSGHDCLCRWAGGRPANRLGRGQDLGYHFGQGLRRVDDGRAEAPVGRLEAGVPEEDVSEFFWCLAEPFWAGGQAPPDRLLVGDAGDDLVEQLP